MYLFFCISYQNIFFYVVSLVVSQEDSVQYQNVTKFLELIPQDTLAVASFRSKAYTRAVMHFESFIVEKKQEIQEHLGFLQVRKCSLLRKLTAWHFI